MANDKNDPKSERSAEDKLSGATAALAQKSADLNESAKRIADLEAQLKAAKGDVASRDAEIASINSARQKNYKLDPSAPFVAKTTIKLGANSAIHRGENLTFDPKNPPPGLAGFREGVHYERARVMIPAE